MKLLVRAVLFMACAAACIGVVHSGNLYDQTTDLSFRFWQSESNLFIRWSTPTTCATSRTYMYPSWQDTAGNGDSLTWTIADSSWLVNNATWGVYDFWFYASGSTIQLLDNYFIGSGPIHGRAFSPDTTYEFGLLAATTSTITTASISYLNASYATAITVSIDDGSSPSTRWSLPASASTSGRVLTSRATGNSAEWCRAIETVTSACYSDTAYFGTFTTADPTRQYFKFWKSEATANSSIVMMPVSNSTAGVWPQYTTGLTSHPMTWHAYATATPGQVLIVAGIPSVDITNDATVTYKVVIVPPLSAW